MVQYIFLFFSNALYAGAGMALLASLAWGVLSVVLSPCHLAGIPLVIGYISGQQKRITGGTFYVSLLFSLGILVSIAVIGCVTGLMGRIMGDIGPAGDYLTGSLFILMGLYLLGWINLSFDTGSNALLARWSGNLGAFMLGALLGIALGPCTFAFMFPVLGLAFSSAEQNLPLSVGLVGAYAVGHCAVIVAAGTSTELVQKYLAWNEQSGGILRFKRVCGALAVVAGVYMMVSK